MNKIKIIFLFCLLLTVPSYFILRSKNLDIKMPSLFNNSKKTEKNLMQEQIDAIESTGEIIITEGDLLSWIKPYARVVEDLDINITNKDIKATGEATMPTRASFEIILEPVAKDGKLAYNIKKMTLGRVTAPTYLSSTITKKLNEKLESNVNDALIVKDIRLEEGRMILEVEKK